MEAEQSRERLMGVSVVGARIDHDGRVADVVAVAPPDAVTFTQNPEAFTHHGDVAVMEVEHGQALRAAGNTATDIVLNEAERVPCGENRTVGSRALTGTVTLRELSTLTTQNLSGNSQ